METKIEVVTIKRIEDSKVKAFASILINESYVIKGFRIIEGSKGLFVGMPQVESKNGRWHNIFSVIKDESRNNLCEIILDAYSE